jgi:hypothetical protein
MRRALAFTAHVRYLPGLLFFGALAGGLAWWDEWKRETRWR